MWKSINKNYTFVKNANYVSGIFTERNPQKIGEKSLNDEIANILNISYDAAHRRSSSKAKFSFEEALELAKHYQISLDQFLGAENQMVVKRTQPIKQLTIY